jgi:Predicted transcriptional regulators
MTSTAETGEPLTIDDLARRVQLPVRTIREYHTMRLLPPPERQGRLGLYGDRHVQRLRLITRLQRRGYSLAGIRDLLGAWESGTDLVTLLGVDESQAALDETPLYLTRAELLQRLPALDEATLARAGRIGLVRPHGDHFGVRSPALLGLVADWVRAGVPPDEALDLIEVLEATSIRWRASWPRRSSSASGSRSRPRAVPVSCLTCSGAGGLCCSRARPARWPTGSARRWPNAGRYRATAAGSWPCSTRYGWARSRTLRARSTE